MDQQPGTQDDPHPDLTFRVLSSQQAADPGGEHAALVRGYGEAVARAFLQGRTGDERHRHWLEHLRADDVTLRGAWESDPPIGDGTIPVATFLGFDKTLNVGGGRTVGLHMITDVTVSPAHRRRGLTRRLMTEDLAAAAARGVPLAGLTVSEGSIYARFGFGTAAWLRVVEVDTTARFALRADVEAALGRDDGRTVLVEPAEAWPAVRRVMAAVHASTRGSVERPQFYEPMLTGAFAFHDGAPDARLRAVVHLDAVGEPDGYVVYRPKEEGDRQVLEVLDLMATRPVVHLRLWRFLAETDLITVVRSRRVALDDPLPHALLDPRVVRTTRVEDLLWVRVLDVVAALEARPWFADGTVVLAVEDPLGHAAGCWRVTARAGRATVEATDEAPEVTLGVDALGSCYLGGVGLATLHRAGRVHGEQQVVGRLAAMLDGGPAPHCVTAF